MQHTTCLLKQAQTLQLRLAAGVHTCLMVTWDVWGGTIRRHETSLRNSQHVHGFEANEAGILTVRKVTVPALSSMLKVLLRSLSWKYLPTCRRRALG